jgi:hypothetical protein
MTDTGTPAATDARELRNHQIRKYRLVVLALVLVAVTALVLRNGVDQQGILLIGVATALTAFRAWQFWMGRPRR